MELTAHGVWTMVHGMGFGALYLLACSGAMVELWRHTSSSRGAPDRTADDTFLRVYLATMAVLADCVNEALDGALTEFLAANAAHNNPSRLARALRWVAQFPASGGHCVRMRLANGDGGVPSDETTSEQTVVARFSFKTEGGVGGAEVVGCWGAAADRRRDDRLRFIPARAGNSLSERVWSCGACGAHRPPSPAVAL